MIEINLIKKKATFELPTVLGINFNQINYKILFIAYLATLCPQWFLLPELTNIEKTIKESIAVKQKKLNKLKEEIGKSNNLEDQLDAFNRQIEKLKQRSIQVENIINSKTNPNKLLERVARSIPEDLWFTKLEITTKSEITIKGLANSYKAIGDFIQAANDTPFFGKSLILSESGVVDNKNLEKDIRLETFEIKGRVETYEPFRQDI
jgi:type IV pilus assembly protein PilN